MILSPKQWGILAIVVFLSLFLCQPLILAADDEDIDDEVLEDHIPFYKTIGITGTEVFSFEQNRTYDYDEYEGNPE